MAKKHSSEALDDPLEAAVFSVLVAGAAWVRRCRLICRYKFKMQYFSMKNDYVLKALDRNQG